MARKPAGWKDPLGSLFFEKPDGRRRCKTCTHDSHEGDAPAVSHRQSCEHYPRTAAVRGPDLPLRVTRYEMPASELEREIEARLSAPRPVEKPRPRIRDRAYLDFVRGHACCSCEAPGPSDPHHWSATFRRGVSQKLDDLLTVPLCRRCHDIYHARNALPGKTRAETEHALLCVQVELLVGWIAERKLAQALDAAGDEI